MESRKCQIQVVVLINIMLDFNRTSFHKDIVRKIKLIQPMVITLKGGE